jgi:hypothetical protein
MRAHWTDLFSHLETRHHSHVAAKPFALSSHIVSDWRHLNRTVRSRRDVEHRARRLAIHRSLVSSASAYSLPSLRPHQSKLHLTASPSHTQEVVASPSTLQRHLTRELGSGWGASQSRCSQAFHLILTRCVRPVSSRPHCPKSV